MKSKLTSYQRQHILKQVIEEVNDLPTRTHGTRSCYRDAKCRGPLCQAWNRRMSRETYRRSRGGVLEPNTGRNRISDEYEDFLESLRIEFAAPAKPERLLTSG